MHEQMTIADTRLLEGTRLSSPLQQLNTWRNDRLQGRIKELDGLRGIAIALVFVWHYVVQGFPQNLSPGLLTKFRQMLGLAWSGVDLFFVLSGFLIGGILLDARTSKRYFATFYARRIYRIFPLYYIVVAAYVVANIAVNNPPAMIKAGPIPALAYVFFVQNFFMAAIGTFGAPWLAMTWSLAIEEHFYFVLPAIIRFCKQELIYCLLAVCVLGCPILRFALRTNQIAEYSLSMCRADALAMGVIVAFIARDERAWKVAVMRKRLLEYMLLLGLPVMLWLSLRAGFRGHYSFSFWGYSVLGAFYATLLLYVIIGGRGVIRRILNSTPLQTAGKLAYSLYLIHAGFKLMADQLFGVPLAAAVVGAVAAFTSSLLLWQYVEAPLIRRAHIRYSY